MDRNGIRRMCWRSQNVVGWVVNTLPGTATTTDELAVQSRNASAARWRWGCALHRRPRGCHDGHAPAPTTVTHQFTMVESVAAHPLRGAAVGAVLQPARAK